MTLDWSIFDKDNRHVAICNTHHLIIISMSNFTCGYHPTKFYLETPDTNLSLLENLWNCIIDAILKIPLIPPEYRVLQFMHLDLVTFKLGT